MPKNPINIENIFTEYELHQTYHPPKGDQAERYRHLHDACISVENRFAYHAPKGDQAERYQHLRDACKGLATLILHDTPICREQAIALTKLEECSMWMNAAIARNE